MVESGIIDSADIVVVVDANRSQYVHLLDASNRNGKQSWHLFGTGRAVLRVMAPQSLLRVAPFDPVQPPKSLWLINTELPDMSGFDLVQMLRPNLAGATSVLIGSQYILEEEIAARRCGATMYLCQPLSRNMFEMKGDTLT